MNYQRSNDTNNTLNDNKEYDYLFKVVLVGDPGVGKSCLLLRFADDCFNDHYYSTIGVDFWDTAGQEKFRCLTNAYYKGANAILLVFDTTNRESFENLGDWIEQINQYVDTDPIIIAVGTKTDINSPDSVPYDEAQKYFKLLKMDVFYVSSKTNINVLEAFAKLAQSLTLKGTDTKDKLMINVGDRRYQEKNFLEEFGCCH